MVKYTIIDGIIIFLLILALLEYVEPKPEYYGRVSREWVETVYWADR